MSSSLSASVAQENNHLSIHTTKRLHFEYVMFTVCRRERRLTENAHTSFAATTTTAVVLRGEIWNEQWCVALLCCYRLLSTALTHPSPREANPSSLTSSSASCPAALTHPWNSTRGFRIECILRFINEQLCNFIYPFFFLLLFRFEILASFFVSFLNYYVGIPHVWFCNI